MPKFSSKNCRSYYIVLSLTLQWFQITCRIMSKLLPIDGVQNPEGSGPLLHIRLHPPPFPHPHVLLQAGPKNAVLPRLPVQTLPPSPLLCWFFAFSILLLFCVSHCFVIICFHICLCYRFEVLEGRESVIKLSFSFMSLAPSTMFVIQ